jgi:hypothetical protein
MTEASPSDGLLKLSLSSHSKASLNSHNHLHNYKFIVLDSFLRGELEEMDSRCLDNGELVMHQ